ncbi:MAG: PilN domain-containing protein [Nitrospirae bacterium]|jgi:type IV pilus assembly protein PilN|nr:PilN domain-containing protein [Nitrospirota bacterium]
MIKVNLLPVKRKKKAKPLPKFIIISVLSTVVICILMAYLTFFFSSMLSQRKIQFKENERKIAQLKDQIKAVDDFEKKNKMFKERTEVIEQLSKNRSVPVKILAEISSLLPKGIWLQAMSVTNQNVVINGFGYTNSEIVSFVDNLKASQLFMDVYLEESKSAEKEKISVYTFKLSCKVKV